NTFLWSRRGVKRKNFKITPATEVIVEDWRFKNRANFSQCIRPIRNRIVTTNGNFSGRWPDLTENHPNARALACAIVAEETKDLPCPDGQVEIIDREP